MDERAPILPPPPSTGLALWAAVNALWFRLLHALGGAVHRAVQVARRVPVLLGPEEPVGSIAALAREGRFTSLAERLMRDRLARTTPLPLFRCAREDIPTVVDGPARAKYVNE
jgi:hypothetical protein